MKLKRAVLILLFFSCIQLFAQDYSATKSSETIVEGQQTFFLHTVEKGNTLYNISKAYNIPPNIILKHNPDINDGLKLDMKLRIPKQQKKAEDFIYHIVKKKETLYQISKIYNVSVDDIIEMNSLTNKEISVGKYLKIPSMYINAKQDVQVVEVKKGKKDKKEKQENVNKYAIYKVQPKETLFSISKRFGISVDALKYLNDLTSTNLSTGQTLIIPKKLTEKKADQEINADKYISHKVQAKETLYGIARLYAVSIQDIEKANELGEVQIQIGQNLRIPRDLNKTGFITHKVTERREKLTKIASNYNMSVLDLKKANPKSKEKLKRGQRLKIPLGYVEANFDQEEALVVFDEEEKQEEEIDEKEDKGACREAADPFKTYDVALMLPLYLNEVDELINKEAKDLLNHSKDKPFKFIEFYEGALLAAQELKDQGVKFKLHVYDIPRQADSTAIVLRDPKLKEMDLMICLSYANSFELISEFSKAHQIPLVNATSKRREIIYNNPYVFKIEPREDRLYSTISDYVINNHSQKNIILVKSNPYQLEKEYRSVSETAQLGIPINVKIPHDQILYKVSSYEMEYPDVLPLDFAYKTTESLKQYNPSFNYDQIQAYPADSLLIRNNLQTVIYSRDSLAGLLKASSLFRDNLVIAFGQDEVFAIELFTQLNSVRDSFNYEVIGLPYWNDYNSLDVEYTQPMKLKVMNSRFVNYNQPLVQDFVLNFRAKYGIEPQVNRYAFLGYDICKYFLTALHNFGGNFPNCINELEIDLLQNQFEFEHHPGIGYENVHWNILKQESYNYHKINK